VYGRKGKERDDLHRQFLHAWRLTVNLPHAGPKTFTAPLAADLRDLLALLGDPIAPLPAFAELGLAR
jgi:hypothetical protein